MVVAFWDYYIITGDIILLYICSCSACGAHVYDCRKVKSPREFVAVSLRGTFECIRKFGCVRARKELFSGKRTYYYIIIYYIPIQYIHIIHVYIYIPYTRSTRPAADVVPRVYNIIYIYTFKISYNMLTHTGEHKVTVQTYTRTYTHILCVLFARLYYIILYVAVAI